MPEEWGPWIEHDYSGCPLRLGEFAEITAKETPTASEQTGGGVVTERMRDVWNMLDRNCLRLFDATGLRAGIIRYRVRKPRGLVILEKLIKEPVLTDA